MTPEELKAKLEELGRMAVAEGDYDPENDSITDPFCRIVNATVAEAVAHIATLEGFKREALAARNILDWRGKNIVSFNPEVAQAEHLIYHAARAANTPERTPPHAE